MTTMTIINSLNNENTIHMNAVKAISMDFANVSKLVENMAAENARHESALEAIRVEAKKIGMAVCF